MLINLILVILITRYLKKVLQPPEPGAEWNRNFIIILIVAIAAFLSQSTLKKGGWAADWIGHILVITLVTVIFKKQEWRAGRPIANAVLPLVAINLLSDFTETFFPSFYKDWDGYFDSGIMFGLIWMGAMLLLNNRQNKALATERQRVEEKEKEIQITEKLKATLEVQVRERTAELTKQTEELQHALDELKAAQAQLIQSEKMASLGELTAGIAHEIQNPLNFVNNFSEVNSELIKELRSEVIKGNMEEVNALADDIESNSEKISHHGKRADAIVKGMLQHSRTSSGQKELTDINELCDEYLRLSYHGLRAKDKSFNAKFETAFDESIGKINMVPQDIGRVILNLINNAFYAVSERKKNNEPGYEPTVTVITKKLNNKIEVRIKDNGTGIPQQVLDKIFQPFFTTKPTGQGTGLGLSLSYDIIKAHSGELKVETAEGAGTTFIITL
ncbi:MAG: ATP-binding protein [Ferruginibacter sp.]